MHDPELPSTATPPGSQRPTQARHLVVLMLVAAAVVLYLDRFCVSFAERYIKQDLRLGDWQMSAFLSAFFVAYALGQVPSGWLGDRFGGRSVLVLYIASWSLFTALIGAAEGAIMLIVMRLGCGLSQAGAYPVSASMLSRWVPFSRRALASGLVALGGRVGAVLAPILTAYLMVLFVPASAPSELDANSILDFTSLCTQLAKAEPNATGPAAASPERRIFSQLPPGAQRIIVAATGPGAQADPQSTELLTAAFNEILRRSDLFQTHEIERLPLEQEAIGLLRRRERGQSLSPAETVRFNRLVLEAIFPTQISKLYVKGWRPVLLVYGAIGLAVALLYWSCVRDSPSLHPRCNAAERALIGGGRLTEPNASATQETPDLTWEKSAAGAARGAPRLIGDLVASRSLWLSSLSQFTTNAAWLFFVTFLPRYLMEMHQVPILERSWMVAIPPLAGIAGMFLGGHLTDRLTRRFGLRWGRALPMGLTRFAAAATYLACLEIDSPWLATIAFALGFFFVDLGVSSVWAYMQDVGGRNVGAVLGWGNMWGNFGAAAAPFLYEAVLGKNPTIQNWNVMFVVCAVMFVVSGLAGLGVDATVKISRNS